MASTSIGRSICGSCPSASRKPARADKPISVPIVSTNAITKIVSATCKVWPGREPPRLSCHNNRLQCWGACRPGRAASRPRPEQKPRWLNDDAEQDSPGTFLMTRNRHKTKPNIATSTGGGGEMSGLHRCARDAERHDAGFVQSDECQEQPHPDREAVAQRRRHSVDHPFPQVQHGP